MTIKFHPPQLSLLALLLLPTVAIVWGGFGYLLLNRIGPDGWSLFRDDISLGFPTFFFVGLATSMISLFTKRTSRSSFFDMAHYFLFTGCVICTVIVCLSIVSIAVLSSFNDRRVTSDLMIVAVAFVCFIACGGTWAVISSRASNTT